DQQDHDNYSNQHATFIKNSRDGVQRTCLRLDEQARNSFRFGKVEIPIIKKRVGSMHFKDHQEASSRQSCLCTIFAMRKSLKSLILQNVNSPNIALSVPSPQSCRGD